MFPDGYARHTPNLTGNRIVRAISIDVALLESIGGALSDLAESWQWVEVGDTVPAVVAACYDAVESWYSPMNIGQIVPFIGSLPDGWLAMDGSTYDADLYPELFLQLDSQFKNVPANEFTLPDLGGLFPLGAGNGFLLGDVGGAVSVALGVDEMPAHTHNYQQVIIDIDVKTLGAPDPTGARYGGNVPKSSAGSGVAHENMPPYVTLNYGVFSGRI